MKKYFFDKEHLIYYENQEDLLTKIKYYKLNLDQAKKIANKGQNFILARHNTDIRHKEFLRILKTIKS
jgi:spore maturation protein CgeB